MGFSPKMERKRGRGGWGERKRGKEGGAGLGERGRGRRMGGRVETEDGGFIIMYPLRDVRES